MPMSLVSENCWISLRRLSDKRGIAKTYLFCTSKMRNLPCPRDKKGGKRVFELCPSCFEVIGSEDFLNEVIYPGLIEPRGPESEQAKLPAEEKQKKL